MSELKGQVGEVRMTINIVRKETGKTETYELIGKVGDVEKDKENGSNTLNRS